VSGGGPQGRADHLSHLGHRRCTHPNSPVLWEADAPSPGFTRRGVPPGFASLPFQVVNAAVALPPSPPPPLDTTSPRGTHILASILGSRACGCQHGIHTRMGDDGVGSRCSFQKLAACLYFGAPAGLARRSPKGRLPCASMAGIFK